MSLEHKVRQIIKRTSVDGDGNAAKGASVISMLRLIADLYPTPGLAITPTVSGAATSAENTTVGTAGKTPYGTRSWRLTTEAINGSYARVTITQNSGPFTRNMARIDPSLPLIVVIQPHAVNGGSRMKVHLSGIDANGAQRTSSDVYISTGGIRLSGESPDPIIPVMLEMASFSTTGTAVPWDMLSSIQIEAFQEGTAGITAFTLLGVYQARQRAQLHIGFDDAMYSTYQNAYPILEARGLVASFSVMGDTTYGPDSGSRTTYTNLPLMTRPEMDTLLAAGWEATVHGTQGPGVGLTYAQALARVTAQKAAVESMGAEYTKSSKFYVYPGGTYGLGLDTDGQPITHKAMRAAGFEHARLTAGPLGAGCWSDALSGLGSANLLQNSLSVNYLRAPGKALYETASASGMLATFEQQLRQLAANGGMTEAICHNVVPQVYINGGQPYVGENAAWTGTTVVTNDISIETFTIAMDLVARYRDLGLIEVVLKRDWFAGVPKSASERRLMARGWHT